MKYINTIVVLGILVVLLAMIATIAFGRISGDLETKFADIVMASISGLLGFLARGYVDLKHDNQKGE